jgi:hypothetical protein
MKPVLRLLVAAGLLAGSPFTAQARIERVVEKTFAVSAAGTLHVETQGGEIRVSPSGDSVVKITARQKIRASSEAEADDLLKKLELALEQSGNDVRATAKYEKRTSGFHFGSWPPVQVDFIITVPAGFATDLHTSGDGITVGDLGGKVNARTSGGGIKLGRIGAAVDARTSGGGISLEAGGGPVELKTSGGNITVGQVAGPATLLTSGGGIRVDAVENSVRAHTSGGSIRVGITGRLSEDSSLSTSGGGVHVTVDRGASFRLDASTGGGGVDAEGLTITIEKSGRDRSRLAGSVNGGGAALKLRSSGGGIVVRTRG